MFDPLRVIVCYLCRVLSLSLPDLCKFNLNWSLKGRLEHRNAIASQLSCHFNSMFRDIAIRFLILLILLLVEPMHTLVHVHLQCSNSQLTRCNGLSTERDPVTSRNHAFK